MGAGQDGGGVGSPSHPSPPTYLDNFQIILKLYKFDLRCKERTGGTLQREEFSLLTRQEGRKKIKKNPVGVGGGPSRSRAKALGQEPPGQESAAPREAGALKICTGFFKEGKALSRELRQILRRGSGGASSLPESPTEVMRRGGEGAAHPGPSWVKGWSAPRGPGGKLRRRLRAEGAASCYLGEPWPESMIPAAQVPDLRVLGDTAHDLALPAGQAEVGRAQDSKDPPATGCPQAVQVSAPPPGASRPVWTGSFSSYSGS